MVRVGHQGQEFNEWHDGRYDECPLCQPRLRRSREMFASLDESERVGVKFGLFPARLQGLTHEDVVDLMRLSGAD